MTMNCVARPSVAGSCQVGLAHAFGPGCPCAMEVSQELEKGMAKHSLKSLRIYGCGWFSRWQCVFFASLAAAPLSHTHRARHRLHGVVAVSSVHLCLCFRFRASLLALSSSFSSQFSDHASPATVLRTINIRQRRQICVNRFMFSKLQS